MTARTVHPAWAAACTPQTSPLVNIPYPERLGKRELLLVADFLDALL